MEKNFQRLLPLSYRGKDLRKEPARVLKYVRSIASVDRSFFKTLPGCLRNRIACLNFCRETNPFKEVHFAMANLPKLWSSPLREIDRMRRDFDELFDRFLGGAWPSRSIAETLTPSVESYEEEGNLVIRADLPGIDPKDVEVTATGNTLTLRAKRESSSEQEGRNFMHREVSYGSFERTLPLPEGVSTDQIKANYRNGVLELTVPMPKQAGVRKVPISIEGGATAGAKSAGASKTAKGAEESNGGAKEAEKSAQ
ncbi:MAG TPA: Hsp20/alpha crystallin family protein [Candidatus Binataceae bacterium]